MASKAEQILEQVKTGYDDIADHFNQTRQAPGPAFQLFKEYIKPGQKILDLGCGNGRLYDFINQNIPGIEYYGVDNSLNLLALYTKSHPEISANLKLNEMWQLDFEDNSFDLVISAATFHHLPNKEYRLGTLNEINRILKPDGRLIMTNWHLLNSQFFPVLFNQWSKKISWNDFFIPWKNTNGKILAQRYYHGFTRRELRHLLEKSNFKIESNFLDNKNKGNKGKKKMYIITIARKD
jgi:tRNA (uracil-5-)-methyltransferase TRM9